MGEHINGYSILSEWEVASAGGTALATGPDGKKVFIKKYTHICRPVKKGDITEKDYKKRMERFDRFVKGRERINNILRSVSGSGGNILVPFREFVHNNQLYEVTEFVENVLPADKIQELPLEDKLMLLKTAVAALDTVHKRGIIHCDLKAGNLMVARTASGYVVGKVIDFDCSLIMGEKLPVETGGDQNYMSPELMLYSMSEGDPECAKAVSYKTDVFSLGMVFYYYLVGGYPEYKNVTNEKILKKIRAKKRVYPCQILMTGGELALDSEKIDPDVLALIREMLSIKPEKRPECSNILRRLKEKSLPSKPVPAPAPVFIAPTVDRKYEDPWPEDGIVWNEKKLNDRNYRQIRRNGSGNYILVNSMGQESRKGRDELLKLKYAIAAAGEARVCGGAETEVGFGMPWPEHGIEYNIEKLMNRRYVMVKLIEMDGKKVYLLTMAEGKTACYTKEQMLRLKYAKEKS